MGGRPAAMLERSACSGSSSCFINSPQRNASTSDQRALALMRSPRERASLSALFGLDTDTSNDTGPSVQVGVDPCGEFGFVQPEGVESRVLEPCAHLGVIKYQPQRFAYLCKHPIRGAAGGEYTVPIRNDNIGQS